MREGVEIVREFSSAFNRGGDGWLMLCDPAVELHMAPNWTEDPVYAGREGLKLAVALVAASFSEYRWDPERLLDRGDRVIGEFRMRGRIRGDGWVAQPAYAAFQLRDGKVIHIRVHTSWQEALEAPEPAG